MDLLPSKEGIKDKTGIRHLVARQGVGLGNAASVRIANLAEVRVRDIVSRTVSRDRNF